MKWMVINKKNGKVLGKYLEEKMAIEHRDYVNAHGGDAEVRPL